ncbi:hypothetical protein ACO0LF_06120 [Undibacterium sp. Di27W]|uniref:hypothetical protein n=1 Tax=Undibacterium sp. Di27W TaxID=3413036 RepID=UPI003BF0C38B
MKKISPLLYPLALFTAIAISHPLAAQADTDARWVHGSWVNVRAKPEANATVLTQLVVNTPVQLDAAASKGEFCAISWGQGQRGFIACKLIGNQQLSIQDLIDNLDKSDDNKNNFRTRAFWIEPSFSRLREAGYFFDESMLSPQQKALENYAEKFPGDKRPLPKRFPIPEFEAMKQRMMAGVIEPASEFFQPGISWVALRKLAQEEDLSPQKLIEVSNYANLYPGALKMLRQIELPAPASSYFLSLQALGKPSTLPEQLSFQFQKPYAIKIISGPYWDAYEPPGPSTKNSWDMGKVDVFLKTPVIKHTLMLSGSLKSENSDLKYHLSDSVCKEGFHFGGPALQGQAIKSLAKRKAETQFKDEALFHFYTQSKLPALHGQVSLNLQAPMPLQYEPTDKAKRYEQFTQASINTFDLDHDGIADFAMIEAWHIGPDSSSKVPEPGYRILFVNAGGHWYLFDIDQYHGCDH